MKINKKDFSGENNPFYGKKHTPEAIEKIKHARASFFRNGGTPNVFWKGKKFSKEHKEKLRVAKDGFIPWNKGIKNPRQNGVNNPNWKGGTTPINKLIRKSFEMEIWRKAVFERDNWTCVWCGAKNGNGKKVILNADHIKPFSKYPALRFAIDNGRTLCVDCHKKTNTFGGKIHRNI